MLALDHLRFGTSIKDGRESDLRGTLINDLRVNFCTFWRIFLHIDVFDGDFWRIDWLLCAGSFNALWRLQLCGNLWCRLISFQSLVDSDCLIK